jgi:hypothetical protein
MINTSTDAKIDDLMKRLMPMHSYVEKEFLAAKKGERRKFAAAACPNASPTSYSGGDVHPGRRQ